MAKLMSYKSTRLGGASKAVKKFARKTDRGRANVSKGYVKKVKTYKKRKNVAKTNESKSMHEAPQYTTYSASGARDQKRKLSEKGLNVKTVKTGSGIFTEYKVYTDKPLPKEKYWD
jgi:hypothetical protein